LVLRETGTVKMVEYPVPVEAVVLPATAVLDLAIFVEAAAESACAREHDLALILNLAGLGVFPAVAVDLAFVVAPFVFEFPVPVEFLAFAIIFAVLELAFVELATVLEEGCALAMSDAFHPLTFVMNLP
jgi:hypothetical protein